MSKSKNNTLNEPCNIYALDVNSFVNQETDTLRSNLPSTIAKYLKYMCYTHVLLLNLNANASDISLGNLLKAFTDAFHSNGIKVILHIIPRDVTDKKLYLYTLKEQIERLNAESIFVDVPYLEYCDKSLIRDINDTVRKISNSTSIIVDKTVASEYSKYRFDHIIDSTPYMSAVDFISSDPYFRRYKQDAFERCLSKTEPTNVIPLSSLVSRSELKSIFSAAFGSYEDKLSQKRTVDLLLMSLLGKKITLMGNEFAGGTLENGKPTVDWTLLDRESLSDMRSFVRSLNHFYLSTPVLHSDEADVSLLPLNENDKEKNIIALKRTSKTDEILTLVNLSGIEKSIDIFSMAHIDCIFATQYYVNNGSVRKKCEANDTYTITLPAFSGAVYRLK